MTSSTIATPVSRFVDTGTITLGTMCATKQGPKYVFLGGRESFVKKRFALRSVAVAVGIATNLLSADVFWAGRGSHAISVFLTPVVCTDFVTSRGNVSVRAVGVVDTVTLTNIIAPTTSPAEMAELVLTTRTRISLVHVLLDILVRDARMWSAIKASVKMAGNVRELRKIMLRAYVPMVSMVNIVNTRNIIVKTQIAPMLARVLKKQTVHVVCV